ncbi:hypothetical protein LX64_02241 [Chitinophaga skermanii]|uniref:Sporulation related protein n=1 Tax=Chitinophaga skermanii TaxID=331697 RepID=A0A327QTK7_9BACT|nr:hypothetical protein [Chitinophaga skermanii]RAJ05087.1 hypothetical protein LX64_02241 [Chitinophaga skermanii]
MLQQYITEVLFKQQTCCVPYIGTFTIEHIPSQFDVADKTLLPPRQQIKFSEAWIDDGSCVQWISHKENLISSVAELKLKKYLESFKATLQTGQPIILQGIGVLRLDAQEHIQFIPQHMPDTWDSLKVQPIYKSEPGPVNVRIGEAVTVNKEVVEHLQAAPSDSFEEGSRLKWWWIALPVLAVGAVVFVWMRYKTVIPGQESIIPATPNTKDQHIPAVKADSAALSPAPVDTVVSEPVPQPVHVISPDSTIHYKVVFESKPNLKAAEKRVNQLKSFGADAEFIKGVDSTDFKIAIRTSSKVKDTADNVEKIKRNYGSKAASIIY